MDFPTNLPFFSLFPLLLFIPLLWFWFNSSSPHPKKLPPSPPKLPIIGNFHQLGWLPHRPLQALSRKYGPLMVVHFGRKPVLVASSAEAAREITKNNDLIFANRPKSTMANRLLYGKDLAFSPYGEYWRQIRSICVLQLLSIRRVQSFRHVREEETSLLIQKVRERCSSSSPVINMTDLFVKLTSDIICRVSLGRKYSEGEDGMKIKGMLETFVELIGVFDIGDYIPFLAWVNYLNGLNSKVDRIAKKIDEFLEGIIEEHINKKKGEGAARADFVDILLDVQRDDLTGFAVERDSLKAVIMDMFAAGTDTTQSVMEWAMVELLRHPETMETLKNEVRHVADGKPEITEDDIEKMRYLKAVIKETLRLHCPLPLLVPRESTQDVQIMGYEIPAGTQVLINAWAIGRDEELWEKAEEFKPERFLNESIDYRGLNFELIPFGAGRRGCPGISFAVAVNELVLAKLVHKFDFALPDGQRPEEMDMTEAAGITVHRKLPVLAVAKPCSCKSF